MTNSIGRFVSEYVQLEGGAAIFGSRYLYIDAPNGEITVVQRPDLPEIPEVLALAEAGSNLITLKVIGEQPVDGWGYGATKGRILENQMIRYRTRIWVPTAKFLPVDPLWEEVHMDFLTDRIVEQANIALNIVGQLAPRSRSDVVVETRPATAVCDGHDIVWSQAMRLQRAWYSELKIQ